MTRIAIVLILAAACGPAGKPPPGHGSAAAAAPDAPPAIDAAPLPLDRDYPRVIARSLAMYAALAAALGEPADDCAAAARKLREVGAAYTDVVAANAKIQLEGRLPELKRALAAEADRFDAAARKVMASPALASCTRDPDFGAALDAALGISSGP